MILKRILRLSECISAVSLFSVGEAGDVNQLGKSLSFVECNVLTKNRRKRGLGADAE